MGYSADGLLLVAVMMKSILWTFSRVSPVAYVGVSVTGLLDHNECLRFYEIMQIVSQSGCACLDAHQQC